MTPTQRSNIICAAICFLFAVIYFYLTISLDPGALIEQVSTKFVPMLLAALMAFLSVLLFIVTLVAAPARDKSTSPEQADRPAFYGTVAMSFLALFVWSLVGFLSIPLLIGGTMVVNRSRDISRIVAIALGSTLVLYLVFFQLFELPLPLGLLEALLE